MANRKRVGRVPHPPESDAEPSPAAAAPAPPAPALHPLRASLGVFLGACLLHGWLQASAAGFPDHDARFHARLADLIGRGEAPWSGSSFPWLTASAYADRPLDWSLGWHLLLVPFVASFGALAGTKVLVTLQAAVLTTVFHAVLRRLQVRCAIAWTVTLVVVHPEWLHRLHMGRPTPAVLIALLVLAYALLDRRTVLAGAAACMSLLLYHVPAPPTLVAACVLTAMWHTDRRLPLRVATAVAIGIVVGILLHPGFWDVRGGAPWTDRGSVALWGLMRGSLAFARAGGVVELPTGEAFGLALPSELGTPSFAVLWHEMHGPLLGTAAAVLLRGWHIWRRRPRTLVPVATATLALVLFLVTLRSGRFSEYWHPFALLAAAVAVSGPDGLLAARGKQIAVGVAIIASLLHFRALPGLLDRWNPDDSDDCLPALAAIEERADRGDIVFNGDFADFAPLFFGAPQLRYVIGMDPYYIVAHDPYTARDFARVSGGYATGTELRALLTERFGARFVLLWNPRGKRVRHATLDAELAGATWANLLHRDRMCIAYEILPD